MLTLPTNSANFKGRLFSLAVLFFLEFLLINYGLKQTSNEHVTSRIPSIHFEYKAIYPMYFFIALIGFLAFSFILSLLSIIKVEVDTTAGSITFIGLLNKQTIATADIKEYLETVHKNPFKAWYGLLIKTHDNKTIKLAGQMITTRLGCPMEEE